jgi:carbon-monoxide dehydrogenase large subunit
MRLVGARVPRVEDRKILTGRGRYIEDMKLPRMAFAAFTRSPMAHAQITGIDMSAARAAPGVLAVLSWAEMKSLIKPMPIYLAGAAAPTFAPLADDKVRLVGDPVAVVVATNRYLAEDAAELVEVSYDPLPAVASFQAALDPAAPLIFEDLESNVIAEDSTSVGDVDAVFAAADRVIVRSFRQDRVAHVPMEGRGAIGDYDPGTGEFTFHCNTQTPHALRMALAGMLDYPMDSVRVLVSEDIGGAFGLKSAFAREGFCVAAASKMLGRPVKWIEDRYEHMLTAGQAREETVDVEVAVSEQGDLLGLRARMTQDQGAYPSLPFTGAMVTAQVSGLLPGPYRWRAYAFERKVVVTNKATYIAYRGPWAVETWVRERLIDEVARELGLDAAEVRRRNLYAGDAEDRLITGQRLAGISTREQLDKVLELIDYDSFAAERAAALTEGRYLGIGFASFIESAPGPVESLKATGAFKAESANVRMESDGHLVVVTSQVPHGQGHQTTLAQIAADEMGVPFEHVRVMHGDTRTAPFKYTGTGGSMASTWASGAVILSTRKVKEKVLAIAAEQLEINADDLEINDGIISPRGIPTKTLPLAQIAMQAMMMPDTLPPGTDRQLSAEERFTGKGITGSGWSGGTHACIVEVDLSTGQVRILRYIVAEDCGPLINPAVVEGQIRGGVAQGIGEVLYEHAAYDEDGNCLTSTFMDYLVPTCAEIPRIEIEHLETDPDGEFGFRGVGEGGTIVAPATLTNAIADALKPFGVSICDQYLPPAKILALAGVIDA